MEIVTLQKDSPFIRQGEVLWFHKGDKFEILEKKEIKALKGIWLKVRDAKYKLEMDCYQNPKLFK